jgi:hypothetical protein
MTPHLQLATTYLSAHRRPFDGRWAWAHEGPEHTVYLCATDQELDRLGERLAELRSRFPAVTISPQCQACWIEYKSWSEHADTISAYGDRQDEENCWDDWGLERCIEAVDAYWVREHEPDFDAALEELRQAEDVIAAARARILALRARDANVPPGSHPHRREKGRPCHERR